MRLSIATNFPEVERRLEQLRADIADTVRVRAVNRTMEQARTAMSREIRQDYAVSASYVRERLWITRAVMRGGRFAVEATLTASGAYRGKRAANVIAFGAREVKAGVSVLIRRGSGRKVIAGAFIGNKGRTVFARVPGTAMASRAKYRGTRHAEKINPVQTIDVPQMFNARRVNRAVVRVIEERFPEVFEREARWAVQRFQGGGR